MGRYASPKSSHPTTLTRPARMKGTAPEGRGLSLTHTFILPLTIFRGKGKSKEEMVLHSNALGLLLLLAFTGATGELRAGVGFCVRAPRVGLMLGVQALFLYHMILPRPCPIIRGLPTHYHHTPTPMGRR